MEQTWYILMRLLELTSEATSTYVSFSSMCKGNTNETDFLQAFIDILGLRPMYRGGDQNWMRWRNIMWLITHIWMMRLCIEQEPWNVHLWPHQVKPNEESTSHSQDIVVWLWCWLYSRSMKSKANPRNEFNSMWPIYLTSWARTFSKSKLYSLLGYLDVYKLGYPCSRLLWILFSDQFRDNRWLG